MVRIWFLWVVFLDSPHFFGTFSRTYLDKREFQQRRTLLTWSLLWFLAGPAMILLGYGLFELGVSGYQLPWTLLLIFLGLWAYWHVVRQHDGFMRLYQKKNADSDPIDARGRLIRHARYYILQLAESYLTRSLVRQIIARIERLAWHPTRSSGRGRREGDGSGSIPARVSLRWGGHRGRAPEHAGSAGQEARGPPCHLF
jgi:hypothetical protein